MNVIVFVMCEQNVLYQFNFIFFGISECGMVVKGKKGEVGEGRGERSTRKARQ